MCVCAECVCPAQVIYHSKRARPHRPRQARPPSHTHTHTLTHSHTHTHTHSHTHTHTRPRQARPPSLTLACMRALSFSRSLALALATATPPPHRAFHTKTPGTLNTLSRHSQHNPHTRSTSRTRSSCSSLIELPQQVFLGIGQGYDVVNNTIRQARLNTPSHSLSLTLNTHSHSHTLTLSHSHTPALSHPDRAIMKSPVGRGRHGATTGGGNELRQPRGAGTGRLVATREAPGRSGARRRRPPIPLRYCLL